MLRRSRRVLIFIFALTGECSEGLEIDAFRFSFEKKKHVVCYYVEHFSHSASYWLPTRKNYLDLLGCRWPKPLLKSRLSKMQDKENITKKTKSRKSGTSSAD